jgi:hypothetical protein
MKSRNAAFIAIVSFCAQLLYPPLERQSGKIYCREKVPSARKL